MGGIPGAGAIVDLGVQRGTYTFRNPYTSPIMIMTVGGNNPPCDDMISFPYGSARSHLLAYVNGILVQQNTYHRDGSPGLYNPAHVRIPKAENSHVR